MSHTHVFTPFSEEELMPKEEKLEIVKKGDWIKSEGTNGYYLEMVVKIKSDYPKEGKLTLTRTCTNEGGFGMLKFKHN